MSIAVSFMIGIESLHNSGVWCYTKFTYYGIYVDFEDA